MDLVATLIRQAPGMDHMNPNPDGTNQEAAHSGGAMHPPMSPFLFTRSTGFFVLFEGALINSTGGFIGALLLSFVFGILATVISQIIRLHENIALADGGVPMRIIVSMLHGFRTFLHYTSMLIVMTMNVWLIIVVVLGHAVGWFIYSLALHNRFKGRMTETNPEAKANVGCEC